METQYKASTKLLAAAGFLGITMIWGGSFVVMKNSVALVPPSFLLAMRFTLGALALALAFPGKLAALDKDSLRCGVVMGLFLGLSYLFQTYGIKYTTASKNAFITALYVILVPFIHWGLSGRRPGINNLAAAVIAVAGLGLLTLHGDTGINLGDILTFICGICFAVHMVCTDLFTERHDPVLLTIIQIAVVGLMNWLLAPFLDGVGALKLGILADRGLIFGLLYLAIFCTMIGFLVQTVGQKYLSANTSSLLLSLEAVFGTVFSVIFLKDVLTGRMLLGCALMFSALLISELHFDKKTGKEMHG